MYFILLGFVIFYLNDSSWLYFIKHKNSGNYFEFRYIFTWNRHSVHALSLELNWKHFFHLVQTLVQNFVLSLELNPCLSFKDSFQKCWSATTFFGKEKEEYLNRWWGWWSHHYRWWRWRCQACPSSAGRHQVLLCNIILIFFTCPPLPPPIPCELWKSKSLLTNNCLAVLSRHIFSCPLFWNPSRYQI